MIIVEGMDNSGKSRIAEHIAQLFNLPLIKRTTHPTVDEKAFIQETLALLSLNPNAVFDRFPTISEAVYGPILRGRNVFNGDYIKWSFTMDKLVKCRPLVIYCRPKDSKILSFGDKEQMAGVVEQGKALLVTYDAIIGSYRGRLHITTYDFQSEVEPLSVESTVKSYLLGEGLL